MPTLKAKRKALKLGATENRKKPLSSLLLAPVVSPMEEIPQSFLYDTVPPLSLSAGTDESPPPQDFDSYVVFRSELTLDAPDAPSPEIPAIGFFSLDVKSDFADPILVSTPPAKSAAAEPETPVLEAERRLETGWFRENSKYKSPMLQLHKG